ncbi:MAG TPA: hypothetical protein P5032_10140, partial [Candidatus Competibacter sp.]|nr:hypothetical protein [Candidatus Competibacter sp.]
MSNRNHMPVLLRRWLARATAATRRGRGEPTNDRDAPDALASGREALAAWFAAEPEQHALAQATLAALARAGPQPVDEEASATVPTVDWLKAAFARLAEQPPPPAGWPS